MQFEEIPDIPEDNNSDIFYKQRPKRTNSQQQSQEWQNKLNLRKSPEMDDRKVEIVDIQLKNDGYVSSHKEYKIKSYLPDGSSECEISRRYSDFEWLVSQLTHKFPGCIIPPLPEKNPLANINQENVSFLENRKRGLLFFLEKMLKHPDLKYTEDFKNFLLKNDIEFQNIVEKSKKPGSVIPTITSIMEHIPAVTSVSFFSNIYSKFVDGEKPKKEKTQNDHKIDDHESYVGFLENSLNELTKYANQMGTVEKDQSNVMLDLSNNLNEISKFDKNNKLAICKKVSANSETCSIVQKDHAKYFHEDLEIKLKETNSFVVSAQEAIKRRNALKEIIEKNDGQIQDLMKQGSPKYLEMQSINSDNREKLRDIDEVLLDELQNFEVEIVVEIDRIAKEFMTHQTLYAKNMYEKWTANSY